MENSWVPIHSAGQEWISLITNSCFTTPDVEKYYTWRSRHQEGSWHARGSACERKWGRDQKRQRKWPGCHALLTPGKEGGQKYPRSQSSLRRAEQCQWGVLEQNVTMSGLVSPGKEPVEDPSHTQSMAVSSQWEAYHDANELVDFRARVWDHQSIIPMARLLWGTCLPHRPIAKVSWDKCGGNSCTLWCGQCNTGYSSFLKIWFTIFSTP